MSLSATLRASPHRLRSRPWPSVFTVMAASATFYLAGGCGLILQPCTEDSECRDDGLFCTGGPVCRDRVCETAGDPCHAGDVCNEDGDRCDECGHPDQVPCDDGVDCTDDVCLAAGCISTENHAKCDDQNPCTLDVCDPVAGCNYGPVQCPTGQECNLVNGECEPIPCTADADCEEQDACTIETCINGECVASPVNCDDGDLCTIDSCDPETGCTSADVTCREGAVCDPTIGLCLSPPSPCTKDADCDDGLFCNGVESCDTTTGLCEAGTDPCETDDPCEPQYCHEDTDRCQNCPPGMACDPFEFTLDEDVLVLSDCDDMLRALLLFNVPTGTVVPSFQTGDFVDGRGGNDFLLVQTNFTVDTTVQATLISVERFEITDLGTAPTTISATEFSGVLTFASRSSTNPNALIISELSELPDAEIHETASGLTLIFAPGATTGTDDTIRLTLNAAGGGVFTLQTGEGGGIETLQVESVGSSNQLERITHLGGSLSTLVVLGDQDFVIGTPLGDTVTTVSATDMTGSLTVAVGNGPVVIAGAIGDDTLSGSPNDDVIDGRAGDDWIDPGAGSDFVTGGIGADRFRQSSAAANGADRQTVTDFNHTPTTGDVFNLNSGLATLDGTDNFASASSMQAHATSGALVVGSAAEVVVVRSGTVTNLTSMASLNGTNLLTAIGGSITVPNTDEQRLFAVADTAGNVGIYFGDSGVGDTDIEAAELSLIAVLQAPSANILSLVFQNFANNP